MHGSVIGLLIEGEHICIAAPLHILVVWSQKLWKGYVALKRTHNAISKSKKLRHNTHTHTRYKWHKFSFTIGVNIEKYLPPFVFHPVRTFSQKWKIGRLFIIIAAFLIYFFSLSFSADFRILRFFSFSFFFVRFLFHCTLFECHICSLAVPLLPHWCRFFSFFLFRMFGTKGIFFAWLTCILNINA